MPKPFITAVIPIHNSEGKTAKLRESIKQASDIHFVLVFDSCDDGTLREFGAILENIEKLNVNAIYGEFGSPGVARNAGLQMVNSEWVVFWDSDDCPEPKVLVECIKSLDNNRIDMVVTQYSKFGYLSQELLGRTSDTRHKYQLAVNPGIWRIAFSTRFIKDVRFPRFRMGEDQCFLAEMLSKGPNLIFNSLATYTYTVGSPGQLTQDPQAKLELNHALKFTIRKFLKTKHNRLVLGLMASRQIISFLKMRLLG